MNRKLKGVTILTEIMSYRINSGKGLNLKKENSFYNRSVKNVGLGIYQKVIKCYFTLSALHRGI